MEGFATLLRLVFSVGLVYFLFSVGQVTVNTARYVKDCGEVFTSPVSSFCTLLSGTVPLHVSDFRTLVPNPKASTDGNKYLYRLREFVGTDSDAD